MFLLFKYSLTAIYLIALHDAMAQQDTVYIQINFEKRIALAEFDVNGKKAVFMLDTGSGISLIDQEQAEEYGIKYIRGDGDEWITGLGGKRILNRAAKINLGYKDQINFKHQFYTSDISHIKQALQQHAISITGILGADFFIKNKVIFNYGEQHLVVYPKSSKSQATQ